MIRAAVALRRIPVTRQDNIDTHVSGALHDTIEVVNLEPEQYSVAIRLVIPIPDPTVMVLHLEAVQLKNKLALYDQLLVGRAPMIAPAAEQALIPAAARFHIGDGD
jgi:hypothetical protein